MQIFALLLKYTLYKLLIVFMVIVYILSYIVKKIKHIFRKNVRLITHEFLRANLIMLNYNSILSKLYMSF